MQGETSKTKRIIVVEYCNGTTTTNTKTHGSMDLSSLYYVHVCAIWNCTCKLAGCHDQVRGSRGIESSVK